MINLFSPLELRGLRVANRSWVSGHYRHGVTLAPLAAIGAIDFVAART